MSSRMAIYSVLAAAVISHLLFATRPNSVVFDEVHFGKFVTAYCCTGSHFFDIHPPHAKLLIAGTARLFGYRGGFSFSHIGQSYDNTPYWALRIFPMLTGIALPLAVYWLLRELKASVTGSLIGGLAVALDNAIVLQTRIIALDGLLLLATMSAVAAVLAAQRLTGYRRWLFIGLAGLACGLAVGTKFTGLVAPLLVCLILSVEFIRHRSWKRLCQAAAQILTIAALTVLVYGAGWAAHFLLLPNPGPGDAWMKPVWEAPAAKSFLANTATLHRLMLSANYNLTAEHPDASPWHGWPLMKKPVYYWAGESGRAIYFVGNPIVWWGAAALGLVAFAQTVIRPRRWATAWLPLAGLVLSLAPLTRIPRALFLYHYLTPLLFSLVFGLLWLDSRLPTSKRILVYGAMAAALLAGFVIMSPVTYGLLPPWTLPPVVP